MTLSLCRDLSPADWIAGSDTPWMELITFGPRGLFDSYGRLRFIPDPTHHGQSENDAELPTDHPSDLTQVALTMRVLSRFTAMPDACFFALWDGYADLSVALSLASEQFLDLPNRRYALFRGALVDIETWCEQLGALGACQPPALIWPSDREWLIASDVDPHWAGIGGARATITALLETPGIDVVRADPNAEQPYFF